MLNALSNVLDHASTIILVIPGSTEKLSESLQEMLNQMTLTFGKTWWNYVVIGVSFWHFDQESIEARITICNDYPDACMDEAFVARKLDNLLQQSCNTDRNFTYLFMDSSAKIAGPPDFNTEDGVQQLYWAKQTGQLLQLTDERDNPFRFWTVDDTRQMQRQILDLENQMKALKELISPIGSIIPWYGENHSNTRLPDGWQLCDGSRILDRRSPMFYQTTPILNGHGEDGLFIRGGSESEAGTIVGDALKNHSHEAHGHNHMVTKFRISHFYD